MKRHWRCSSSLLKPTQRGAAKQIVDIPGPRFGRRSSTRPQGSHARRTDGQFWRIQSSGANFLSRWTRPWLSWTTRHGELTTEETMPKLSFMWFAGRIRRRCPLQSCANGPARMDNFGSNHWTSLDSNTYNGLSRLFEQLISITADLRVAVDAPVCRLHPVEIVQASSKQR